MAPVTCRLTAEDRDQLCNRALVSSMGLPLSLTFYIPIILQDKTIYVHFYTTSHGEEKQSSDSVVGRGTRSSQTPQQSSDM